MLNTTSQSSLVSQWNSSPRPNLEPLTGTLSAECLGTLRGVLWYRFADSRSLEAEPLVALNKRVPTRNSYHLKQLPDATLACVYSGLDDESAEQAYAGIRKWMNAEGTGSPGPKRELYLGQMLEIQFPLVEN